jgi:hypothetical protein
MDLETHRVSAARLHHVGRNLADKQISLGVAATDAG